MKFTIAIEAGTKEAAFGVAVPDLPGCFSAGDTVEEAFENVREAIDAPLRDPGSRQEGSPAAQTADLLANPEGIQGLDMGHRRCSRGEILRCSRPGVLAGVSE